MKIMDLNEHISKNHRGTKSMQNTHYFIISALNDNTPKISSVVRVRLYTQSESFNRQMMCPNFNKAKK